MGKYLHRFKTLDSFKEAYGDSASTLVTAFTCSSGTFVYDRCDGPDYIWKNGNTELFTTRRNAAVGDDCGLSSGAYDPVGDACIEITAVSTIERDTKYKEPWASYTTYEKDTELSGDWWFRSIDGSTDRSYGSCTLKYKGEVSWEGGLC